MIKTVTIEILNWGHADPDVIESLGFLRPDPEQYRYHGQYEVTENYMWSIVRELWSVGLNVMVLRGEKQNHRIIVNSGSFNQR